MMKLNGTLAVVLVASIAMWPMAAMAGSSARIIPTGKVSLLENGKATRQIGSEMPLPDGVMMLCNGQCMVRADGLQLIAKNDAVFGVAEGSQKWSVTVKSGQLDFALVSDAKLITFYTPHDVINMEEAVFAASDGGALRGTITVTEANTRLAISEGTVRVSTENGTKILKDGAEIRSAQVQMAPATDKEENKKKAAGAMVAGGSSGAAAGGTVLGMSTGAAVAGGVGVAAIAGFAIGASESGGSGKTEESPSTPGSLQ